MSVSTLIAKVGFLAVKHGPTILTAVGITSLGAAVVTATHEAGSGKVATERFNLDRAYIKQGREEHDEETYTKKMYTLDMAKIYLTLGVDLARAYKNTILLAGVGIAAIGFGHAILTRRINSAVAAYSALDAAFTNYRKEATKLLGASGVKEVTTRIMSDSPDLDLDGPDGQELHWNDAEFEGGRAPSPYARIFGPHTTEVWDINHNMNLSLIAMQQNYFNDILRARGHLFLNEVYEAFGLSHTPAGALCGWILNSETGDGYVDFQVCVESDILVPHPKDVDETVPARSIFLDFNVDGEIWNKI